MFGLTFRSCLSAMALLAAATCFTTAASAATLDFESIGSQGAQNAIEDGYGDLRWSNFYVLDGDDQYPSYPNNGYGNGTASGDYVAFNGFGAAAAFSSSSTFDFISAAFTAAWNEGLKLNIVGYRNGAELYSQTVTLTTTLYSTLFFNWTGIDKVAFFTSGGTPIVGKGGHQFVIDDLNVVQTPIPAALPFLALGLAGLGYAARRRRAAATAA